NGAVVVWLASGSSAEPTAAHLADASAQRLAASQALAAADAPGIALWLVTTGATLGHDSSLNLLHAPVAGMFRTVATELPGVVCRLLDLDPASPDDHVELALAEFWAPPTEDEIAYRNGERFANQLAPANPDALPWRTVPAARRGDAA